MKKSGNPSWALICQPSLTFIWTATEKTVPGWIGSKEGKPWAVTTPLLLAGTWLSEALQINEVPVKRKRETKRQAVFIPFNTVGFNNDLTFDLNKKTRK